MVKGTIGGIIMKQKLLILFKAAIGKRKYVLSLFIASVFIGGLVTLGWYYSGKIIPYVQAGEGEAINPELKETTKHALPDAPAISGEAPQEEKLTYEEVRQEKYAKTAIKVATMDGLQRVPGAPKVQSKTFYSYSPTALYEIFCHEGYLTDIQLQPGEDIQFIGGGDTVRWIVDKAMSGNGDQKRWHIYVKPLKSGIMTNFMITTDKRAYQIRARSTADFYSPIVGWTYPLDDKAAFLRQKEERLKKEEEEVTPVVAPDKMNFNYSIDEQTGIFGGSFSWTPKMVFDDGTKTYIQMSGHMSSGEAPALFVKSDEGLALVNYRVKGNYYIVDRLFQKAEMRNGLKETVVISKKN